MKYHGVELRTGDIIVLENGEKVVFLDTVNNDNKGDAVICPCESYNGYSFLVYGVKVDNHALKIIFDDIYNSAYNVLEIYRPKTYTSIEAFSSGIIMLYNEIVKKMSKTNRKTACVYSSHEESDIKKSLFSLLDKGYSMEEIEAALQKLASK